MQESSTPLAELHRHLDVSTRMSTVHELALKYALIPQSTSLEALIRDTAITEPMKDLGSVLRKFSLFQEILRRPEDLIRLAFEVAEDCAREGIRRAELRFSPGFVEEKGRLSWELILDSFEEGLRQARIQYQADRGPQRHHHVQEHRHPGRRDVDKNDAVGLALLGVGGRDHEADVQADGA